MNYFLWTEDSTAGKDFWKLVSELRYEDKLEVRYRFGNQKLIDALENYHFNSEDYHFVAFDTVGDNSDIRYKYLRLLRLARSHHRVILLDILCFEYLLLKFPLIGRWTGTTGKKFERLTREFVSAVDSFNKIDFCLLNSKDAIDYYKMMQGKSTEAIFKSLAGQMLQGNHWGLREQLGGCWSKDCCAPELEGLKVNKSKCSQVPKNGVERMQMLINSPEILRVLTPIDKVIQPTIEGLSNMLNYDSGITNKMTSF